jgi:hypothetical protein
MNRLRNYFNNDASNIKLNIDASNIKIDIDEQIFVNKSDDFVDTPNTSDKFSVNDIINKHCELNDDFFISEPSDSSISDEYEINTNIK